jgi:hypothetical protein
LFKKPKNGESLEKSCFSSVNQPSFLGNLVIYKEDDDRTTDFFQKKLLFFKPKDGEFSGIFLVFQV